MKLTPLGYSVALHVITSVVLFNLTVGSIGLPGGPGRGGSGDGDQPGGGAGESRTITSKPITARSITEKELGDIVGEKGGKTKDAEKCEDWYGGIGVYYSAILGGLITEVHPGYPADKAGIKSGDYLLSDPDELKGEPGVEITVNIRRDGKLISVRLTREKICVERKNNE